MSTYCDRVYIEIAGSTVDCASIDESMDSGTEPVPTMNRENKAKGYKDDIDAFEFSLEVPKDLDASIDFIRMKRDKTEFETTVEEEGGEFRSYIRCRIIKVDLSSKTGDNSMIKLDCKALNMV